MWFNKLVIGFTFTSIYFYICVGGNNQLFGMGSVMGMRKGRFELSYMRCQSGRVYTRVGVCRYDKW